MVKDDDWADKNIPILLSRYNKKRRGKRKRMLTVEEMEEGVRAVCSGRMVGEESADNVRVRTAHYVLQVYLEKCATFYNSKIRNWRKVAENNNSAVGCCSRAAIQAQMCGATYEDYLEAQFWFFNQVFGRVPKYSEIASSGALLRYKQWRVAKVHGEAPDITVNIATGGSFNPKDTLHEVVLNYENQVLERMSNKWGGEAEVWRLFGEPGNEEVFTESFKRTREIWKKMYGRH